jgi:hypothetical protein
MQQLLQGTQANLMQPFWAESGSYAMIQHVQTGPALLELDASGDAATEAWH